MHCRENNLKYIIIWSSSALVVLQVVFPQRHDFASNHITLRSKDHNSRGIDSRTKSGRNRNNESMPSCDIGKTTHRVQTNLMTNYVPRLDRTTNQGPKLVLEIKLLANRVIHFAFVSSSTLMFYFHCTSTTKVPW